jgi:hypothetical protein
MVSFSKVHFPGSATHVRPFKAVVNVVELEFDPDIVVAAFLAPHDRIMTKGRGRSRLCRKGKGKVKLGTVRLRVSLIQNGLIQNGLIQNGVE